MLRELILLLIRQEKTLAAVVGQVQSVDGQTCTVLPLGAEAPIQDVRLMATIDENEEGILVIPRVGSYVCLVCISANAGEYFVGMFSEIDAIMVKGKNTSFNIDLTTDEVALNTQKIAVQAEQTTFNNGNNGGLVRVAPLVEDMQKIHTFLKTLVTAIQTAPVVAGDGGASLKTALASSLSTLPLPLANQYENPKISH